MLPWHLSCRLFVVVGGSESCSLLCRFFGFCRFKSFEGAVAGGTMVHHGLRVIFKEETLVDYSIPERGDIVVFTRPDKPSFNIIKRVIGLPGDKIELRGQTLKINGKVQKPEDYVVRWIGRRKDFKGTVPEGRVFLLGDNRGASKDSRYWEDHYLEISRIKGRAFFIYWNSRFIFSRMFNTIK